MYFCRKAICESLRNQYEKILLSSFFRKIYHDDEFSCFTRFMLRKLITEHRKSRITDTVSWRWRQNLFFFNWKKQSTHYIASCTGQSLAFITKRSLCVSAFLRYFSKSFMYNGKAAFVFNFKRKQCPLIRIEIFQSVRLMQIRVKRAFVHAFHITEPGPFSTRLARSWRLLSLQICRVRQAIFARPAARALDLIVSPICN